MSRKLVPEERFVQNMNVIEEENCLTKKATIGKFTGAIKDLNY